MNVSLGERKQGKRRGERAEGEGGGEEGEGWVRLNLPLLGQDSLVLCTNVGGDFYGGGAVGLADEFDFFGRCCAWSGRMVC